MANLRHVLPSCRTLFYGLILSLALLSMSSCAAKPYVVKNLDLESDVVVMYTAEWCTACDEARQFLINHKIDFVELDYENEKEYARLIQLSHKLKYRGVFDSVPVFIVRNIILVGYSPDTILWILADID